MQILSSVAVFLSVTTALVSQCQCHAGRCERSPWPDRCLARRFLCWRLPGGFVVRENCLEATLGDQSRVFRTV
ncbi:hypothetical protein HD554DRAFT_2118874 [Boletus coccyginus]|nr:hypothetical protein HD554DRAFT_2118874 [Boletus coccyginus]